MRAGVKKFAIGFTICLSILICIGLGAGAKIPEWLKSSAQTQVREVLGRELDWERIEWSITNRRLIIHNLSIGSTLTATRIEAVFDARSLTAQAPIIESLSVEQPAVKLVRISDGVYNFSDILQRLDKRPKKESIRFSVSNIQVSNGHIELIDQLLDKRHTVEKLSLSIPFVNQLVEPSKATIAPSLQALVNNSPLELKGQLQPFGDQVLGQISLSLSKINLAKWRSYWPKEFRFDPAAGFLDTDLLFRFKPGVPSNRQNKSTQQAETTQHVGGIEISGVAQLSEAEVFLRAPDSKTTNAIKLADQLTVRIALKEYSQPTNQLHFERLEVQANSLFVERNAQGQVSWTHLWVAQPGVPPETPETQSAGRKLTLAIDALTVSAKQFIWNDAFNREVKQVELQELKIVAGPYSSKEPLGAKWELPFNLSFKGAEVPKIKTLALSGRYAHKSDTVQLQIEVSQLELASVAHLWSTSATPRTIKGLVQWQGAAQFVASDLRRTLTVSSDLINVSDFELTSSKASPPILLKQLAIHNFSMDYGKQRVKAAKVHADQFSASIERSKSGVGLIGVPLESSQGQSEDLPWVWSMGPFQCKACRVGFVDQTIVPAFEITPSLVNVELGALSSDSWLPNAPPLNYNLTIEDSALAKVPKPTAVGLSVSSKGSFKLNPFSIAGTLQAKQVELAKFEPYYTERLKLRVTRGNLFAQGSFDYQAPSTQKQGQVSFVGGVDIANFQTIEKGSGNEFVRWEKLRVPGLRWAQNLAGSESFATVETGLLEIDQLYARVILDQSGQLNLRDGISQSKPNAVAAKPASIRIGGVQIRDGNINFSDQFVRPNYSANLTQLTGEMSALAADLVEPATLKMTGRVDNDAPLTIEGTLNPLAPRVLLDIRAQARSVELTSLSPYSARWAGYAIEKGKLTATLHYQIAQGQLNARNELFLNQLVLGEKVESPDATKLPVKLAVALLKNSKGEIELDLPISGTLSDPEFSVGPIVWRAFLSLIGKVLLSPFNALASVAGNANEELSYIDFASGSTDLNDEARKRIASLAAALKERQALNLDITGKGDEQGDRAGLQRVTLDLMLKGVKMRRFIEANPKADPPDLESIVIALDERNSLIGQLYKEFNLPNKPKNALGFERSIDAQEQQRLLQDSIAIPLDLVRQLAARRGALVREILMRELPGERLFVIAPKVISDAAGAAQNRRVEFALH